jgi:hypothetical protein
MLGSWGRAVALGLLAGTAAFFGAATGLSGLPVGIQLASAGVAALTGGLVVFLQTIAPVGEVKIPGLPPNQSAGALPALTHPFVGRRKEMIETLRWLRPRSGRSSWAAVGGLPGVGKTAFALVIAHRLRRREYPGPVIFVRLTREGSLKDPRAQEALKVAVRRNRRGEPRDPELIETAVTRLTKDQSLSHPEALESILRAMKVPPETIAADAHGRREQITQELTGQRALLVLDAVADAAQVRDIELPADCAAIVTSTDELRLLRDKPVHEIWLHRLTLLQGWRLLAQSRLLGGRVWRQPWCARRLVQACGGLPQELMLRAGELRGRFERKRSLCDAIQTQLASIDSLDDPRPNIWTALAATYHQLPDLEARAFLMVGLLEGIALDAPLLAAALGPPVTEERATGLLRNLVGKSLLEPVGRDADRWLPRGLLRGDADHWLPHSLVRVYAHAMASLDLSADEREQAISRTAPLILARAKRLADLVDSPVARLYPELAALAQSAIDEEWEHGTAVVDRAVAEGLDLFAGLQDEGVDLLLELLSRPRMLRANLVIDRLATAADDAGREDIARRARSLRRPALPRPARDDVAPNAIDPADKEIRQPGPRAGRAPITRRFGEELPLGQEMPPTDPGPLLPRAWGVAIWVAGCAPNTPVALKVDGHLAGRPYTDARGAITHFETTIPGPTPPRSVLASGSVEEGHPPPTGGFDTWPLY